MQRAMTLLYLHEQFWCSQCFFPPAAIVFLLLFAGKKEEKKEEKKRCVGHKISFEEHPIFFFTFQLTFPTTSYKLCLRGMKGPEGFASKLFLWAANITTAALLQDKRDASKDA